MTFPETTTGREFVWGIDPAISHISFAFADTTTPKVHGETLHVRTEEREGARLGLLDRKVRLFARVCKQHYPPACVWVEMPAGRVVKPALWYAVGVLQAALFESLGVPVWTIPPGTWKKRALGYGNATPEQYVEWARAQGFRFDSHDEAAACGVAVAGRAMLLSRSWEATAA